jgi:putative addiction module component (TIGR02574 family)
MRAVLEKVEREALRLSQAERAFLADRLISSLDTEEALGEVDAAWVAEAERRYREYGEGKRQPIAASEVFADADRLLKRSPRGSIPMRAPSSWRPSSTTKNAKPAWGGASAWPWSPRSRGFAICRSGFGS